MIAGWIKKTNFFSSGAQRHQANFASQKHLQNYSYLIPSSIKNPNF